MWEEQAARHLGPEESSHVGTLAARAGGGSARLPPVHQLRPELKLFESEIVNTLRHTQLLGKCTWAELPAVRWGAALRSLVVLSLSQRDASINGMGMLTTM